MKQILLGLGLLMLGLLMIFKDYPDLKRLIKKGGKRHEDALLDPSHFKIQAFGALICGIIFSIAGFLYCIVHVYEFLIKLFYILLMVRIAYLQSLTASLKNNIGGKPAAKGNDLQTSNH